MIMKVVLEMIFLFCLIVVFNFMGVCFVVLLSRVILSENGLLLVSKVLIWLCMLFCDFWLNSEVRCRLMIFFVVDLVSVVSV